MLEYEQNKNYINLVILNGIHKTQLSDNCEELIFDKKTLKIPKNKTIEKPIHVLFITSQDCDYSIDVIAEENSCFTIIEEHTSSENLIYTNNIKINITAKKNSKITYYKMQNENLLANHLAQTNIKQKQNSSVISGFVGNGGKIVKDTINVKLEEKNANYNAIGIISLRDSQLLSYQIKVEHLASNCTSNVLFKGIINDNAIGDFKCLILAHPNAFKTETHVTNKNLLLSELATMNTAPELEIYTDDVVCTHGATVGQLDKDALFYLRSRGLSENKAIELLTTAFTQEIIDKFDKHLKLKITHEY